MAVLPPRNDVPATHAAGNPTLRLACGPPTMAPKSKRIGVGPGCGFSQNPPTSLKSELRVRIHLPPPVSLTKMTVLRRGHRSRSVSHFERKRENGIHLTLLRAGVYFYAALDVAGRRRPEQKAPQVRSHPAENLRFVSMRAETVPRYRCQYRLRFGRVSA